MILCENSVLCFSKSTGNKKRVILHKSFFHKSCLGKCWELMEMFHLLKLERVLVYSEMTSVYLLLASSIYLVMTLKNTDQASAKLIRLKFNNMLVLTIQDDFVGLYGYQNFVKKLSWL